jgi:fibronectin type 3 domain-containing protein
MTILSRSVKYAKSGVCLLAALLLSGKSPLSAQPPPPVPASFQALYTSLDNYLVNFNAAINSQWNGTTYPVLFTANLADANADAGPQIINSGSVAGIQAQLQELKAMGVQAVTVEVSFPMLYEPFFSSQAQYQQYVAFYQNLAASVRALGLKLIVENEVLLNDPITDSWNVAPFYASLNWTQYQAARAQTAVTIAQTMQPDYMVLLEEPDTEATMTGQTQAGTVAGATSILSGTLSAMQTAGVSGVQFGAGVGTWLGQYQQFIQSFLTLPVNFIDMHVLTVNNGFLPNALSIASMAAAAGIPVTMTQSWLHKEADSELNVLSNDQILARNPFSFWAPLDAYFVQTMQNMAYYTHMTYMDVFESPYFFAYLPYGPSTENLSPSAILSQETQQSGQNMLAASFTSTAMSYYSSILPAADTTPPSMPGSLTGSSSQTTQVALSWNASTDDVGVAGYYVFRNGVTVVTTAQAFYVDTGLTDGTTYSYFVEAFDLAGNVSAPSLPVNVTTWNSIPPSAPANLVATVVSCKELSLTWSASTDQIAIGSYSVFRGTSASNLTKVATYTTPTSYISYPLTPSTTYYFGVQAVDTDGNVSAMSAIVAATTLALPAAPASLVATPVSTTAIGLTWTAGPSGMPLTGYYVFLGTTPSNLTKVATSSVTSYTGHSLTPGTTYYYAVEEFDQGGNVSPMSAVGSATTLALPSPPVSLVATPVSTTSIGLTWTAGPSSMPLTGYYVFLGTTPSNLTKVATSSATSYTGHSLTPGTAYYYAVEEFDQGGDVSPMSAVGSATTLALPSPPASVTATAVSKVEINVTWTAAQSGMPLASYRVSQGNSTSNLTQFMVLGSTITSLTIYPVTPATTYYYGIQSTDTGGNVSPMSVVAQVTTPNQ